MEFVNVALAIWVGNMLDFLDAGPLECGGPDNCRARPKDTCDFLAFIPASTLTTVQQDSCEEETDQGFVDLAASTTMILQGILSATRVAAPAGESEESRALLTHNPGCPHQLAYKKILVDSLKLRHV